jgi:hypothetical protein
MPAHIVSGWRHPGEVFVTSRAVETIVVSGDRQDGCMLRVGAEVIETILIQVSAPKYSKVHLSFQ